MLQWGKAITQAGDPLQKITVEEMFRRIRQSKPVFQDRIEQLRAIKTLDERQYRELKKGLPYFVCGLFHPPVRRRENFAEIGHFLLDLDHLSAAEMPVQTLALRLTGLPEIEMCFTSPGGDGLKLLFRLREPCRDSALFSAFFKVFARRFAAEHQLEQVIDLSGSDVSRACFVSFDPYAYYQPEAQAVDLESYLPRHDFEQAERIVREAEKTMTPPPIVRADREPDQDVLQKIRQKLNPGARPSPRPKQYYVPPELDKVMPLIREKLDGFDLALVEENPINYGRQLRIGAGHLWAELNLFYGKRGFRVVKTTKSGSHADLADLAVQVVEEVLFTLPNRGSDGPT